MMARFFRWLSKHRMTSPSIGWHPSARRTASGMENDDAALIYSDYDNFRRALIAGSKRNLVKETCREMKYEAQKYYSKATSNSLFEFVGNFTKLQQKKLIQSLKYVDEEYYPNNFRSKLWTYAHSFHSSFRSKIVDDATANIHSTNAETREKAIECIAQAEVNNCLTKRQRRFVLKLDRTTAARLADEVHRLSDPTYKAEAADKAEKLRVGRLRCVVEEMAFDSRNAGLREIRAKRGVPMTRQRDGDRGI